MNIERVKRKYNGVILRQKRKGLFQPHTTAFHICIFRSHVKTPRRYKNTSLAFNHEVYIVVKEGLVNLLF